ncbi:MAG: hypothetical protein PUJ46_02050 [Alistipes sp.]|jgi:hypothetical protein|nr:hypothetical protein [Alistipes sp.]
MLRIELAQSKLDSKVEEIATAAGLLSDGISPITDGVYDAEKYLTSDRKVMWIMVMSLLKTSRLETHIDGDVNFCWTSITPITGL